MRVYVPTTQNRDRRLPHDHTLLALFGPSEERQAEADPLTQALLSSGQAEEKAPVSLHLQGYPWLCPYWRTATAAWTVRIPSLCSGFIDSMINNSELQKLP